MLQRYVAFKKSLTQHELIPGEIVAAFASLGIGLSVWFGDSGLNATIVKQPNWLGVAPEVWWGLMICIPALIVLAVDAVEVLYRWQKTAQRHGNDIRTGAASVLAVALIALGVEVISGEYVWRALTSLIQIPALVAYLSVCVYKARQTSVCLNPMYSTRALRRSLATLQDEDRQDEARRAAH